MKQVFRDKIGQFASQTKLHTLFLKNDFMTLSNIYSETKTRNPIISEKLIKKELMKIRKHQDTDRKIILKKKHKYKLSLFGRNVTYFFLRGMEIKSTQKYDYNDFRKAVDHIMSLTLNKGFIQ